MKKWKPHRRWAAGCACVLSLTPCAAPAQETATYTYDAKGRVVAVQQAGGPLDGASTGYRYDKADNRRAVDRTGFPSPIVIVALMGISILPIN